MRSAAVSIRAQPTCSILCFVGYTILCWLAQGGKAEVQIGSTSKQPVLDVTPEIFTLRKLLPQTGDYDFNVHIMDFRPGEYLYVKVLHTLCHFGVCPADNGCICSRLHLGLAATCMSTCPQHRLQVASVELCSLLRLLVLSDKGNSCLLLALASKLVMLRSCCRRCTIISMACCCFKDKASIAWVANGKTAGKGVSISCKSALHMLQTVLYWAPVACKSCSQDWELSCCRYPVQAGDAIWMAPYVVQWYAALGNQNSRYILYKDTTLDPLLDT